MKNETTLGGVVYFAQCRDAVKIGYTAGNPADRVSTLQTGCPWPIWLLGSIPSPMAGEALLHNAMADCRLRGEWFDLILVAPMLRSIGIEPRLVYLVGWVDSADSTPKAIAPTADVSKAHDDGTVYLTARVIASCDFSARNAAYQAFEGACRIRDSAPLDTPGYELGCYPVRHMFHLFEPHDLE